MQIDSYDFVCVFEVKDEEDDESEKDEENDENEKNEENEKEEKKKAEANYLICLFQLSRS